jgi:hypothetical protein
MFGDDEDGCRATNLSEGLSKVGCGDLSGVRFIEHFYCVINVTIALQLVLRALGITEGDVVTTSKAISSHCCSMLLSYSTPSRAGRAYIFISDIFILA